MNTEIETLYECVKIYEQIIRQEIELTGKRNPAIDYVKSQIIMKIDFLKGQELCI
jgi:hypothetical protein